ncbi:hypothetical protein F8388_020375 [Cannabis sativa]|jgi:hypothetical protein|uniref:DUF4408 domain-containing protein n=1 Tax=Cannabis sativa TaxID=3483 RepID=A0A7J6HJB6_CANSA|nr:hypothetical protein G4B88_005649 [Cannabis sativa]KAF4394550.1 hypothetical protein F8388_020375 [Cannabis sativa]
MENKFKKSQVLVLSLLAILLVIAPLLSSSLRPTYLYFITNLLIIVLGAEAGLLSLIFSKPLEENNNKIKNTTYVVPPTPPHHQKPAGIIIASSSEEASPLKITSHNVVVANINYNNNKNEQVKHNGPADQTIIDISHTSSASEKKVKIAEKTRSQKVVGSVKAAVRVKKCPSMPSLFFIGSGDHQKEEDFDGDIDGDDDFVEKKKEEEVGGEITGQELFTKAETFIGNFYKQLKMQREDSWKKIHGFYQRAF